MAQKKSFTEILESQNPADSYFRGIKKQADAEQEQAEQTRSAPTRNAFKETKSVHLQLLIRPAIKEALLLKANAAGLSMNEYINQLLEDALYK